MSVRLRLTLWYTGILTATLLIIALGLYFFLNIIIYSGIKADLEREAEQLTQRIKVQPTLSGDGFSFNFVVVGRTSIGGNDLYVQVEKLQDGTIQRSDNMVNSRLEFPKLSDKKIECVLKGDCEFDRVKEGGYDFLIHYTPLYPPELFGSRDRPIGMLQSAFFVGQYERIFVMLRFILTITMLLAIVLAASVGWFLARKALRPIEQVIAATNSIENGTDLKRRIEYNGPGDEIGVLTQTINNMLERLQRAYSELEEAYGAQRRFVSDASHELRTPLTTIRGNVELLEKMWKQEAGKQQDQANLPALELSLEAMRDISGEAERMSRLVNDLLALARADAGFQIAKQELEVKSLLEEIARKAQLLPRTAEWIVGDLSEAKGVKIYGNPDYLQQMTFIFIENAFKYTEQGYVQLDALRHAGQIGIRIKDTGMGMDKKEVPLIFERFYRADVSRGQKSGTGLGLAIAKWIIDEHQGSVEVTTSKGEGTTFVIWLPLAHGQQDHDGDGDHSLAKENEV